MPSTKNGKICKKIVKDTEFFDLFSISKYKKALYVSLFPKDKNVDEKKIETVTLRNILTNGFINDLTLAIRDILLMFMEAQSK